jgi:GNAT superfamily N-acetyltransferase
MVTLDQVVIRRLTADDSLHELTRLVNLAYRPLAEAGLHFVASHQGEEVTAARVARGECWVAVVGEQIVGTITMIPPGRGRGCPFYERDNVATLQQLAVDPEYQGNGIGGQLLHQAETAARAAGAITVAFDTAGSAFELIATYRRHGYAETGTVDWRPRVNYRSVILAKAVR